MAEYVFPAVIEHAEDGYNVSFPDIQGCYTCGENLTEAIAMAEDALALFLYQLEVENQSIPVPSDIKNLTCGQNKIITLVYCNTLKYVSALRVTVKEAYRERLENKIFKMVVLACVMLFIITLIVLLKDKPDILERVIGAVGGLIAGCFGGFGYGYKRGIDE